MPSTVYDQVFNYSTYITAQSDDFWGRDWLLNDLNDWLEQSQGSRFFVLTGEPGSGKTSIASRLVQIALGNVPAPNQVNELKPGFLSAIHFCAVSDLRWVGDRHWYHPRAFSESLARQLAVRYPEYASALIESSKKGQIVIKVDQHIEGDVTGTVSGAVINHLDVSRLRPEDTFEYVVREPLETLLKARPNEQIVILVDALDEALQYRDDVNIAQLLIETSGLPDRVRFIVTARPGVTLLDELANDQPTVVHLYQLEQEPAYSYNLADIESFVIHSLAKTPSFARQLSPELSIASVARSIRDKSDGNFLYVSQLLKMLQSRKTQITPESIDELPDGLLDFYRKFLRQIFGGNTATWDQEYAPVLGTLAVAQEALTSTQLASFTQLKKTTVRQIIGEVRQLLDYEHYVKESERTYSFFHRSFAEFLLNENEAERFWCDAAEQHQRIADHYLTLLTNVSAEHIDTYGLRYVVTHLAEAIRLQPSTSRHKHTKQLVDLLGNTNFERVYQQQLQDLAGLQTDILQSLYSAATNIHREAWQLIVEAGMIWVRFGQQYLQPQPIFSLAEQGQAIVARRRLDVFALDPKWQQVAVLVIAWLAADQPSALEDARLLRTTVVEQAHLPMPVPILIERVDASLFGHDPQPTVLAHRHPDILPTPDVAQSIVARFGGISGAESLREYLVEPIRPHEAVLNEAHIHSDNHQSIYTAAEDGPALVAAAFRQLLLGEKTWDEQDNLDQYLDILSANNYVTYRNGALWVLLDAVLQHPDQRWVRAKTRKLVTIALQGSRLDFQHTLPLTMLGLRARHDNEVKQRLSLYTNAAQTAAAMLIPARGQNDAWGSHKRTLIALAQVYARILNADQTADTLLNQALYEVPFGYAGFQSPACLSLAEAIRVCRPADQQAIEAALLQAQEAAHRVQDSRFCARTTARWNAMYRRWWKTTFTAETLTGCITRFSQNARTAEFAAVHLRSEDYIHRGINPDQFQLADNVRYASSLVELAEVYECSFAEMQRLNPNYETGDGTDEVNIPDPGLVPLIAAHLAAEVLVLPDLSASRRVELIQQLVPIAATNLTALDNVLARLVIAASNAAWVDQKILSGLQAVMHVNDVDGWAVE